MSQPDAAPMTVEEFLAWQAGRQQGPRFELLEGRPIAMAPERLAHMRTKTRIWRALADAVTRAALPCEALPDGATVAIDESTAFEPDALVYCGDRLPGEALLVPNPVIVVEVLSPTTERLDAGGKLEGYFTLPSVAHYLLVKAERACIIHHRRGEAGHLDTQIVTTGTLDLDPPGLSVAVDAIYEPRP
jgi:Uma2 family endonuclease